MSQYVITGTSVGTQNSDTFIKHMSSNPSYVADFTLIKLPQWLAERVIVKKGGSREIDLSDPVCASLFLHEWIHYLHNISTLNGIYAFAGLLNMWANFRHKLDQHGISVDTNTLNEYESSSVRRTHAYRMSARRSREYPSVLESPRNDFELLSAIVKTAPLQASLIDCDAELATIIQCTIQISSESVEVEIGIVEILEGLAFMLEERFLRIHGQFPSPLNIAPYRLLFRLARYIVHDIEDDDVIACAVTSLQSDDPPLTLMEVLNAIKDHPSKERRSQIEIVAKTRLSEYSSLIKQVFIQTEQLFPLSEPMGDAVKNLLILMQEKLKLRENAPFFELLMLDQIKSEPEESRTIRLRNVIAEFSCPRILATNSGDGEVGRDDILNFGNPAWITEELVFGQQKLHAALHYLWLHLSEDGFLSTEAAPESLSRRRCPFYSACTYQLRRDQPELCASRPWESLKISTDPQDACWYRAGVRATRPPQEDLFN